MSKVDLNNIIKNVKQPVFDDEMIIKMISELNIGQSFYNSIQNMTEIIGDKSEINREEEQKLWNKKMPGTNQDGQFRHMGSLGDIGYCFSRLYVNCTKSDLMKLANFFTDKCNLQQLPCYFKYSSGKSHRSDQLIIYSNLKDLSSYIQIMQEIGKENPDIIQRCGKPPILTGKINEWIGIGDEPNQSGESFTGIRADIIENVLKKNVPLNEKKDGFATYMTEGIDFDIIREELKKAFKDNGIDMSTFSFNNENLQLYMADEQTRMDYDTRRKEYINNKQNNERAYLTEQLYIQELKILKGMGYLTNGIEDMIDASSSRYGFLSDMIHKNLEGIIGRKFGLSNIRFSSESGIQLAEGQGVYSELSHEQRQELGSKIMEDVKNYYIKYIDNMMPVIDEKLSRYVELLELPSENRGNTNIEKADLYSRLKVVAKGKAFFETIGVPNEQIEIVCNRAAELLNNIEQQRDDKDKIKREAIIRQNDRDFLYVALQGLGTTDIEELRKIYEEQDEIKVSDEDLEIVLQKISNNKENKIFSEKEIGKATINVPIEQKDKARQIEEANKEQKNIMK